MRCTTHKTALTSESDAVPNSNVEDVLLHPELVLEIPTLLTTVHSVQAVCALLKQRDSLYDPSHTSS